MIINRVLKVGSAVACVIMSRLTIHNHLSKVQLAIKISPTIMVDIVLHQHYNT